MTPATTAETPRKKESCHHERHLNDRHTVASQPAGALIAVLERVPHHWFGDKARLARHSVLVAMAKYANRNGENVCASVERIAHTACVRPSTARAAIKFLVRTGRLKERPEPHPQYGTKIYDIVLPTPEEATEAKRELSEALEKGRVNTRERVAKHRQKMLGNTGTRVTKAGDVTPGDGVTEAGCNAKSPTDVTPDHSQCNAISLTDVTPGNGVDLYSYLPSYLKEKESTAKASLPAQAKSTPDRQTVLKEFRTWQAMTWPRLSLTKSQRNEITAAIENDIHDLRTYQEAAHQILDGIDVTDSYSHAENKLASGLADKAAAIAERRKLEKKRREYEPAMAEAQAAGDEQRYNEAVRECELIHLPGECRRLYSPFERKQVPLTPEELEEREKNMAALRQELGVTAA